MEIDRNIFRQSDFIEVAIRNVVGALRDGAILVIAIVFLFLASVRATGITVLAIPLSLVTAILAMRALGASINTMTLGGLAIAVGALVDDAIIDVENVVRRLRENAGDQGGHLHYLGVVFEASREIRGSIVFATLIIILVFLPLFFLSGVEGRLLAPLGFAYVVSLAASLVVALTVTPALCLTALPNARAVRQNREGKLVHWLKARTSRSSCAPCRAGSSPPSPASRSPRSPRSRSSFAGRAFLPEFNEGTLTLSAVTLPGTSLEESNRLGLHGRAGAPEAPRGGRDRAPHRRAELDEHAQDVNSAEIDVGLRMKERSQGGAPRRAAARLRAASRA